MQKWSNESEIRRNSSFRQQGRNFEWFKDSGLEKSFKNCLFYLQRIHDVIAVILQIKFESMQARQVVSSRLRRSKRRLGLSDFVTQKDDLKTTWGKSRNWLANTVFKRKIKEILFEILASEDCYIDLPVIIQKVKLNLFSSQYVSLTDSTISFSCRISSLSS